MTPDEIMRGGTRQTVTMTVGLWVSCFVLFTVTSPIRNWMPPWAPIFFVAVSLTGLSISAVVYLCVRRAHLLRPSMRWTVLCVSAIAGAGAQSFLDHVLFEAMQAAFEETPMPHVSYAKAIGFNLMIYVWLFGMYVAALELMRSLGTIRDREAQLAQAREAAHQAQLAALRFQLNPHFLFNTLNAISSLVIDGQNADAERMMAGLCDFLRASLEADPDKPVPLAKELAAVETYLEIERVRFGDRLSVRIDSDAALDEVMIPGLILQPLVENAVKYAVAPSRETVTVSVTAVISNGALLLTVEDHQDGARSPVAGGTGLGLANVRGRLEGLHGAPGSLDAGPTDGGYRAVVRLPIHLIPPLAEVA